YFLAKPELVSGKKVPAAALKLALLIETLFQSEPDINKLSALLNDEPTLVLGMLRIANSPLYRKTRDVSSVKELLMRLGIDLTRKWVLMFAVLNQSNPATASLVLTRAYFLLKIAKIWQLNEGKQPLFFLTGLLSGVDMLFGVLPAHFVADLSISDEIKQALCLEQGEAAKAVALVKQIEKANSLKIEHSGIPTDYFSYYNSEQYFVQEVFAQYRAS
ncbi:MAG TPA: HDOD domain-containing protein, partial [Rheinheimera sp.]|nr:HDOD domain-containing protein [Rheinheimera sp.]